MFDEIAEVGRLDDDDAIILEHVMEAFDHAVEVGDVGQDVVGVHDVRAAALGGELARDRATEEFIEGGDALLDGDPGDVGGGFDAEDGDAGLFVELEEVSVVRGDFGDEAGRAEAAIADDAAGEVFGVGEEGIGEGGEVEVFAEEDLGWDGDVDLNKCAVTAEDEFEGVARFGILELFPGTEGVGQGLETEGEDGIDVAAAAGTAGEIRLSHGAKVRLWRT
jgi:hypothetical protein